MQNENFTVIEEAYRMFFNAIVSCRIDTLVESAYELLKYPILVTDEIATPISLAPREKTGDPDWDFLIENGSGASIHFMDFYKKYFSHPEDRKYPILINDGHQIKKHQLISVITYQKKVLGHSAIVIGKSELTDDEKEIIELFNTSLTAILKVQEKKTHLSNEKTLQLFSDIITGTDNDYLFTSPQMDKFKTKYPKKYALTVSKYKEDIYVDSFYSIISNEIMTSNQNILSIHHDNMIINIVSGLDEHGYKKLIDKDEYGKSFRIVKKYDLYTSISSEFENLDLVKYYYQQALLTLNTGIKLNPQKNFFTFSDYMPAQYFYILANSFPASVMIHPIIKEIIDYDRKKGTNYYSTLEKYVLCMLNTKSASEELHVHKNTMVYRINRIQELFSIDFEDHQLLNTLFCNFYILKINGDLTE